MPPIHPGEILQEEFLKPTSTSVGAFAAAAGLPAQQVQAIIAGTESIAADTAAALSAVLGTRPEWWLSLQATHDQRVAEIAAADSGS